MKISFLILLTAFCLQTHATVDALTSAWIVTQNIQDADDFQVMKVPVLGCYGMSQGPQLMQFTAEHNIKDSMGCGNIGAAKININALSCAQLESAEENSDHMSYKKITLNLSNCSYKDNPKFITMVRTAAHKNFLQTKNGQPDNSREVELILK